ncbi:MAG: Spy/CpxP family protein refolding chaperone [Devosia sp.]|nr:Spy/CpxP family protein refolding chaperone [Devosia sp.]
MKLTTSTSAALIVAALGLAVMTPAAIAQDQGPRAGPGGAPRHEHGFRAHNQDGHGQADMRRGMHGGVLELVCSPRGAERLEHMFVAISHRVEPTAEQSPLFDALKTAALTAQTGFADTCATVPPEAGGTAGRPDLVERLETRIKVDEARIAALSNVLPSLEAFYGSLSDEQKQKLEFGGEMHREHMGQRQGKDRRPDRHRPMMDQNG